MSAVPVPPPSPRAVPTVPAERQPVLDVLRGAALLGILLVNVELMAGPGLPEVLAGAATAATGAVDRVVGGAIGWLVAGKFISSFSILFGVGAAVIAERALARGRAPRRLLARRYGLLVLMGLAHTVLLFPGDVLFVYGLAGFILLLFLRSRDRTLAIWAVVLIVVTTVALAALAIAEAGLGVDEAFAAEVLGRAAAATAAYAAGDYAGVVMWNGFLSLVIQSNAVIALPWFVALFLVGVLAHRRGYALAPAAHRAALVRTARVAVPVGLVLNLPLALTGPVAETAATVGAAAGAGTAFLAATGVANALGAPVLAVGYLAALAVLVVDRGADRGLRRRLAALGRIALTGYLAQSVLALVVFLGLRRYGDVAVLGEPALGRLLFVAGVWAVLLTAAPWWTARFRYGPVEWLWRWGTYGRRPALRG
jgi:uncharacterized protein